MSWSCACGPATREIRKEFIGNYSSLLHLSFQEIYDAGQRLTQTDDGRDYR